jgi:hypothetical protein
MSAGTIVFAPMRSETLSWTCFSDEAVKEGRERERERRGVSDAAESI